MTLSRSKEPGESHRHKQDKACDPVRALGPTEQKTADGPVLVLIREGENFPREVSWSIQGRQRLSTLEDLVEEEERILGEGSLLSTEAVLCFLLTPKSRHLPSLLCVLALLTIGMRRREESWVPRPYAHTQAERPWASVPCVENRRGTRDRMWGSKDKVRRSQSF